ncbi:MAG: TetR/AcrR family transcriptional regulator [Chloroflexota bacterium]
MSPAPSRTSNDAIVAAARRILETDGVSALTMARVAEAVGVKGPSLYKRVPDREALLRAVADGVVDDLRRAIAGADATEDPAADLAATATAYRTFVQANPNGYRLLFSGLPSGSSPDPAILAALGEPIVRAVTRLAGEGSGLEGARTFVAWAHGFVSMELSGAFRLGGDLDAAYAFGVRAIIDGVSGQATRA